MSLEELLKDALHLCSAQNFYVVESGALLYKTVAQLNDVPAQSSVETLCQTAREEFVRTCLLCAEKLIKNKITFI